MKELINNELAQLQKDLENLQSAAKMISTAGEASSNVIEQAKTIQNSFATNLEKLTSLYKQYLDEANKNSSQHNDEVVAFFKKTVSEQTSLFDKYGALVSNINENSKKLIETSQQNQNQAVDKLIKLSQEKINAQDTLLKKSAAETSEKVEVVKKSYLKQAEETDRLLKSYLELAQSTEELKQNIDKVDFPSRFDKLSALVNTIVDNQKDTSKRIDTLSESGVKTNKQILDAIDSVNVQLKTVKLIAWILTILTVLSISALVFVGFKYHIFDGLF